MGAILPPLASPAHAQSYPVRKNQPATSKKKTISLAGLPCAAIDSAFASTLTPTLLQASGVDSLDSFIAGEANYLASYLRVWPQLAYFDEKSPDKANAFASPPGAMGVTNNYGMVGIGLQLIKKIKTNFSSLGVYSNYIVAAILAHEFAHITQIQSAMRGQHFGITARGKKPELHGDFVAGVYLASRHSDALAFGIDLSKVVEGAFYDFMSKGDTYFTHPLHHGTPQERLNAVRAGFNHAYGLISRGAYVDSGVLYKQARLFVGY